MARHRSYFSRRVARRLVRSVGLTQYLRYAALSLLPGERLVRMTIRGEALVLRTRTPDLIVAEESLGSEYTHLAHLFPVGFDGLIVDAGGYIGTAALTLSRLYPAARVVTIEPSSANFAVLTQNIQARANITAIKAALVDAPGKTISLGDRGTGHWGFTIVGHPSDAHGVTELETVPGITLPEVMQRMGTTRIELLKLDIEGAELALFRNCPEDLARADAVFAELHDKIVDGCKAAFLAFSHDRWVVKAEGEKYLSLRKPS
jgi:FkbM family methyltransferase